MEDFIKHIPKAELHVHIEGTLEPELMLKIAQRNQISVRFKTVAEVRNACKFNDLQLEKNAFVGSFISDQEKQKYITELDEFYKIAGKW